MRRLLPLALLLAACSKAPEAAPTAESAPAKVVASDLTPEGMAKAMDLPLYPGATAPDGMSAAPVRRDDGSTHYALALVTDDPPAKVLVWYGKALGDAPKGGMVFAHTRGGNDVSVRAGVEAGRTIVRLTSIAYAR